MRKKNTLKERLKTGEVVFGPWCVLPSAAVLNVIAATGVDFVIIDLEHGAASFETAEDLVRTAESEGCCPLIRVGQKDEINILKALDLGAHGIIAPHVEKHADAREVVSYSKYYPLGTRGYSPFTRAGGYGGPGIINHAERENLETLVGVILEGKNGIENLDSIIATEKLDLIYIGAYDLSQAMGMPGQVEHPAIKKEMEKCIRKIRDGGIAAGGYVAKNVNDLKWMVDMGMQFITCLPDVTIIHQAFSKESENFREVIKNSGGRK